MIRAVWLDPLVRLGVPIPRLIADFVRDGLGGISIDPRIPEDFPETPFCLQMYRNDLAPLLGSRRFGIPTFAT